MAVAKPRVLIVDGYNVIRSSGAYAGLCDDDFSGGPGWNAARAKLLADVATVAQGESEAVIVFDGGGNPESTGEPIRRAGVTIIYSETGTDADQVIERLAHDAYEKGKEVTVVTSDSATQWTVMGDRVTRMSSVAFGHEIKAANDSWQERNPSPKTKRTLGERLDPRTTEKLARWARGEIPE